MVFRRLIKSGRVGFTTSEMYTRRDYNGRPMAIARFYCEHWAITQVSGGVFCVTALVKAGFAVLSVRQRGRKSSTADNKAYFTRNIAQ